MTQIKVEMTMYCFNNIYIEREGERNQGREMLREWKKEREKRENNIFLFLGMLLHGM